MAHECTCAKIKEENALLKKTLTSAQKEMREMLSHLHGECSTCSNYSAYHNRGKCATCIYETAALRHTTPVDNYEYQRANEVSAIFAEIGKEDGQ